MTVSSKAIPNDLLDALMSNYPSPEDLIGGHGLLKQLTKAIVERALEAEMTAHLGHDKHEAETNATGNARNGKSRKTLKGDFGVNMDGHKEVLGLWIAEKEGAKFWLHVVTKFKNRGVNDILIACVDGLKSFPEAIETVFPKAAVQLCIVHPVRNSLNYVSYKKRQAVADDLKRICQTSTALEAEQRLTELRAMAGSLSHHRPHLATKTGSQPNPQTRRPVAAQQYPQAQHLKTGRQGF